MFGKQRNNRHELAEKYQELETVLEVRNGPAWQRFSAMLERWAYELDESVMELSNKYDKHKTEILYKTAQRNCYMKLLHAMTTISARHHDLENEINNIETILGKAPQG